MFTTDQTTMEVLTRACQLNQIRFYSCTK